MGRTMKIPIGTLLAAALASGSIAAPTVWEPPRMWWDDAAPQTMDTRDFMANLNIGSFSVVLEQTLLENASNRFHAAVGSRGDAGEALNWVCLGGNDEQGKLVLWLESGEIHGSTIGGVLLQRLSPDQALDKRCGRLAATPITMPLTVRLGMTKQALLGSLGRPTSERHQAVNYSSCHTVKLKVGRTAEPQTFDQCSSLSVRFEKGVVCAFEVWRTTTS